MAEPPAAVPEKADGRMVKVTYDRKEMLREMQVVAGELAVDVVEN